jgi:hypothetical protein
MNIKLNEDFYNKIKYDFYYHTKFNEHICEDEDIKSIIKVYIFIKRIVK